MQDANLLYLKKRYLKWFLDSFVLKEPEAAKILSLISSSEELLEKIHFVDDVRKLPNAMIVSAGGTQTVSFLFRLNGVYYEDINQILALLSNKPPGELFIRLSFNKEIFCTFCDTVLEPSTEVKKRIFYHRVLQDLEKELNEKVNLKIASKKYLMNQIDKALKQGNRDMFYKYSYIYRQIS